jgi:hypothetical protein
MEVAERGRCGDGERERRRRERWRATLERQGRQGWSCELRIRFDAAVCGGAL